MHYSSPAAPSSSVSVAVFLADAGLASPARIVGAGTVPGHGAACFADARLLKPALCTRKSQEDDNQLSNAPIVPHNQDHSLGERHIKPEDDLLFEVAACLGPS